MMVRGTEVIVKNLNSFVTIFALVKRKKNESLNLKIDCDMVSPQSLKEQPVAHFVKVML